MKPAYSKVQCKNTNKYGDRQHYEHFACIPIAVFEHLGLRKLLYLKWTPNEDGTVTVAKSSSKLPSAKSLTYHEWLAIIESHIPVEPPGKNPFQIHAETGIDKRSIPAIWVERAKRDVSLQRSEDSQTHKTLWYKLQTPSTTKLRKITELKQTQLLGT